MSLKLTTNLQQLRTTGTVGENVGEKRDSILLTFANVKKKAGGPV